MGKKRKRSKQRHAPPKPRHVPLPELSQDAQRFISDLQEESDWAVVLMACAFLEDALDGILRALLRPNKKILGQLLDCGSLATLGGKADLIYLLWMIDRQEYDNLDCLRNIRNRFAHSHQRPTFDDPEVKAACRQLNIDRFGVREDTGTPRERFIRVTIRLAVHLKNQGNSLLHGKLRKQKLGEGPLSIPPTWMVDVD